MFFLDNLKKYNFFILLFVLLLISTFFWWHFLGNFEIGGDAGQYHIIAQNLLNDNSFSYNGELTMFREPGYPFFLSLVYRVFSVSPGVVRLIQFFMLFSVALITYYLSDKLFNKIVAKISSILVVIFPFFNILTSSLLSEILACWLIMIFFLIFYLAIRRRKYYLYGLAGVFLGSAIMVKSAFIFVAPAIFSFIIFYKFKENNKSNIGVAVIFGIFVSLIIIPWLARNYVIFNKISPASRGGVLVYTRALKNTYNKESVIKYSLALLVGEYPVRRFIDSEYIFENDYIRTQEIRKFRSEYGKILNTNNYDIIDAAMLKEANSLIKNNPIKYVLFGFSEVVILNSPMIYYERHFSMFHDNIYSYTWPKTVISLALRFFWWIFIILVIYAIVNMFKKRNYLAYIPIFFILEINLVIFFLQGNPRFLIPIFPFYLMFFVYSGYIILKRNNLLKI